MERPVSLADDIPDHYLLTGLRRIAERGATGAAVRKLDRRDVLIRQALDIGLTIVSDDDTVVAGLQAPCAPTPSGLPWLSTKMTKPAFDVSDTPNLTTTRRVTNQFAVSAQHIDSAVE